MNAAVKHADKYIPVTESGCWIWIGTVDDYGYGRIYDKRNGKKHKKQRAHRVFYVENVGPIPDGLYVCHKCDTPSCVNPKHLFLGTHADNMTDRRTKDRYLKGEMAFGAKLTEHKVLQIRDESIPSKEIQKMFGISRATVEKVRKRRSWSWLP